MYRRYYYSVPYQSIKKAKKFATRMKKSWGAKVSAEKRQLTGVVMKKGSRAKKVTVVTSYDFEVDNLRELYDSEMLNGHLDARAHKVKKNFDIRSLVKKDLKKCLKEDEKLELSCPLEAMNIVRKAVGLKPLAKDFFGKRKGMEILRVLAKKSKIETYKIEKLSTMNKAMVQILKVGKYKKKKGTLAITVEFKNKVKFVQVSKLIMEKFRNIETIEKMDYPTGKGILIVAKY